MRRVAAVLMAFCMVTVAARGRMSLAAQDHAPVAQEIAAQLAAHEAESWMATLDAGKYAESWKAASEIVKNAVTMEKFESSIKTVRDPMGKLQSRKLRDSSYTTLLPGVPPGEYVVILYESNFEHKPATQETVIMAKEKDKVWRVAGYYIK